MFYYTPTGRHLEYQTLPINLVHADTISKMGNYHLDMHNVYGTKQAIATADWFVSQQKMRPFIVSRNTFSGIGKYSGKALAGHTSTYEDMRRTVTSIMMMNIQGVPFTGGDICGFSGPDANPELCVRWHQVGAFQPLSRNHRDCKGKPQEPFRFMENKLPNLGINYTTLMKKAIFEKYSLLRYYYT
jgi:alpha-glucosidase (family GH31 glycosyl hydrolase)